MFCKLNLNYYLNHSLES